MREAEAELAAAPVASTAPAPQAISVDQMAPYRFRSFTGAKFPGGMSGAEFGALDYWSLRERSSAFFATRLFARGIVRRLVTGVITAGLYLECTPVESLLGLAEDSLVDWAESVEQRFTLWSKDPFLCDTREQQSFGALQAAAFREALVAGDCLVALVAAPGTKIPRIKLISGELVRTPSMGAGKLAPGHRINEGVELDAQGRHVAYWIRQDDGSSKRLPAWGEKSGRRLAWLVYASDKRHDEVRGQPLLSLVLQSISELDKYRDSTQRKALLNSVLAAWIEKTEDKPGSRGLSMGAIRNDSVQVATGDGSESREFSATEFLPGMWVEELQTGEKIHQTGGQGTDEKYGDFEEAIVQGIAWSLEIPPEILRLSFSSNYSASKAAENNFAVYLFATRTFFGEQFCQPIYVEWLLAESLAGNIPAQGLLDAWRDPASYVTFGAWTLSDWSGNVKPSVDPVKQVNAYMLAMSRGLIAPETACREFSGQKLSRNLRSLKKYYAALKEAGVPDVQPKPEPSSKFGDDSESDDEPKDKEDAA